MNLIKNLNFKNEFWILSSIIVIGILFDNGVMFLLQLILN